MWRREIWPFLGLLLISCLCAACVLEREGPRWCMCCGGLRLAVVSEALDTGSFLTASRAASCPGEWEGFTLALKSV